MNEDKHFVQGNELKTFKTKYGEIGIELCYDIRFPELTRKLTLLSAKIIFIPSEFPRPRLDHWITLLKARAIENQIFVVAVNRIGRD